MWNHTCDSLSLLSKNKKNSKDLKRIDLASLIAAMILPFSTMDFAEAQTDKKNPRDKTVERTLEKEERKKVLNKLNQLDSEEKDLKEKAKSEKHQAEKQKIDKRLNEIKGEKENIDRENHNKDIPQKQLSKLIKQQDKFEARLLNSDVIQYVTLVGIDITSKEIQVGINQNLVNDTNIDSVINQLDAIMPKKVNWHTVYSDVASTLSCTQKECDPLIGGNYIKVASSGDSCSFGFQAKKGSTWGWITAGHCADGLVNSSVKDYSNDNVGTVKAEKMYWGTYCDCAWVEASSSLTNNEVFDVPSTHTVKRTTQASQQQNDYIMGTGQAGGIAFGQVSAINVTVLNIAYGEYHKGLVRSDASFAHGDSGGPVVEMNDRSDLYGIITTHDWWGNYHTPIDNITSQMGVTVVLN